MRFGKRLVELVQQNPDSHLPYVSYKELKHLVGEIATLLQGGVGSNIRLREDEGACSNSAGVSADAKDPEPTITPTEQLESFQRDFFDLVDQDVAQGALHVQSTTAALEIAMGEWQASAIGIGVLVTPEQLDAVAECLPFPLHDRDVLARWLTDIRSAPEGHSARLGLVDRYSSIVSNLGDVVQYAEVNLTAVRKILKKFMKNVPADTRIQDVGKYKRHSQLLPAALIDVTIATLQAQRLLEAVAADDGILIPAAPRLGPESVALLTWIRGPAAVDEMLGVLLPQAPVDVYAKPCSDPPAQPKGPADTGQIVGASKAASKAMTPDASAMPTTLSAALWPQKGEPDCLSKPGHSPDIVSGPDACNRGAGRSKRSGGRNGGRGGKGGHSDLSAQGLQDFRGNGGGRGGYCQGARGNGGRGTGRGGNRVGGGRGGNAVVSESTTAGVPPVFVAQMPVYIAPAGNYKGAGRGSRQGPSGTLTGAIAPHGVVGYHGMGMDPNWMMQCAMRSPPWCPPTNFMGMR